MNEPLLAAGWHEVTPTRRGVTRAWVFERGADGLILEERGAELWLWIESAVDRRVLSLRPSSVQRSPLVAALVEAQSDLSVQSYLGHYLALQRLAPVSIVAWEQLDDGA